MKKQQISLIVLLSCIVWINGHPTKYPEAKKEFLSSDVLGAQPPIRSYHVHFMFQYHHNTSCTGVDNALALRNKFIKEFNVDELLCEGDFDQGRLCMFPVAFEPYGPFVAPEWAAFIPLEDFQRVVPWVMQNRGNFDVFVHPNSGFEREDHHDWSFWAGTPWFLDLSDPEFAEQLHKNTSSSNCP
eukprot:TRINITY_DN4090_c0_g1_i1.p1 TRINITY_DN4090_c0_g1~~TRINITY_DN4090_c0_g1_i1.p1  ORF type:complete len:185 (+),score=38.23 TRINITY_DN4090_c0_g1_i1:58-612(+)